MVLYFGDVNFDEDGLINVEQFARVFAEVVVFLRRCGLVLLDVGDVVRRVVNQKFFLIRLDTKMVLLVELLTISLSGFMVMW